MKEKGFAPILVILLVTAILGGYLVYSGKINLNKLPPVNNQTSQGSSSATPTDETANWEIYVNKDFGFSFKYPSKFRLEEDKYIDDPIKGKVYYFWFYVSENGVDKYSGYSIRIHKSAGKTIAQEYSKGFTPGSGPDAITYPIKPLPNTHGADEAASPSQNWKTDDRLMVGYFRVKDTFFEIDPIFQDSNSIDKIWNYPILDTLVFNKELEIPNK